MLFTDDAHMLYNVTHLLTFIRINNYTIHHFVPIQFRIISGLEPIPAVRELKVGYAQDMFVTELTEKQKTIDSNIHTYRLCRTDN